MPVANVLKVAHAPITSPIALFEAVLGICRKRHASVEEAEENVREFLDVAGIELIPITAREAETALSAFSRYERTRPPRAAQPWRLLCLRGGQEPPPGAFV
jgi:ribonuclease VapC